MFGRTSFCLQEEKPEKDDIAAPSGTKTSKVQGSKDDIFGTETGKGRK